MKFNKFRKAKHSVAEIEGDNDEDRVKVNLMMYTGNKKWCIECYNEENQQMETNMGIVVNVNDDTYLNISKMEGKTEHN